MNNSHVLKWPEIETLRTKKIRDFDTYVEQILCRINKLNDEIGAFLHVNNAKRIKEEVSLFTASESDGQRLKNVPVAIKDAIAVHGMPLTCGSRILENFYPPKDATVVRNLRVEGAVIVGKTNLDEFAMGSSNENSAYGVCRNPWNLDYVSGGSSGGSAAAVAAGMVPVAIGSDTGGSVRQPAAFCGVVGFKPSYGAVSRYGLVAYGSSLDQIGVIGSRTEDVETVFEIIHGQDDYDETLINMWHNQEKNSNKSGSIGVIEEYINHPSIEPEIQDAVECAINVLRDAGYVIKKISLPMLDDTVIPAYYLTACAEASSNLSRYDGVRYGPRNSTSNDFHQIVCDTRSLFGPEVKLRILLGTFILRSGHYERYYGRAQVARKQIANGFEKAFREVDLIVSPTSPTRAFRIGELIDDPLAMKLADIFTVCANLAGLPALSLPVELTGGLPSSVQILGPRFSDKSVLETAKKLESLLNFDPTKCPFLNLGPRINAIEEDTNS